MHGIENENQEQECAGRDLKLKNWMGTQSTEPVSAHCFIKESEEAVDNTQRNSAQIHMSQVQEWVPQLLSTFPSSFLLFPDWDRGGQALEQESEARWQARSGYQDIRGQDSPDGRPRVRCQETGRVRLLGDQSQAIRTGGVGEAVLSRGNPAAQLISCLSA